MLPDALARRAPWIAGALVMAGVLLVARPAPAYLPQGRMPAAAAIAKGDFVPGELVVHMLPGADADAVAARLGMHVKRVLSDRLGIYQLAGDVPNDRMLNVTIAAANSPGIDYAAPNFRRRATSVAPVRPDDPQLAQQWSLRRIGNPTAQGILIGQRDVNGPRPTLVAILDTGVSPTQPDLQNQDFADAANFTNDIVVGAFDNNGHGTHVAGIAAALTNNGIGVASPGWEGITILPVKVLDAAGGGSVADSIAGIIYSTFIGADVINMSYGGSSFDANENLAISFAVDAGVVCVAASGNDRDPDTGVSPPVLFPSGYLDCISVGATGPTGELAYYSSGGAALDLVAPGGNNDGPVRDPPGFDLPDKEIMSTTFEPLLGTNGFGFKQGTSMASPCVAGIASSLLAAKVAEDLPMDRSRVDRIRFLLVSTATNPYGHHTDDFGFGAVNFDRALQAATEWIDLQFPLQRTVMPSFAQPLQAFLRLPNGQVLTPADFEIKRNVTMLDGSDGLDITAETVIVDPNTGAIEFEPGLSQDPLDPFASWGSGNGAPGRTNRISLKIFGNNGVERSILGDPVVNPLGNNVPSHDFVFLVNPFQTQQGLRMFSIPHTLLAGANTISFLFGGNPTTFARWVTPQSRYAVFNTLGSPQDPEADLLTNTMGVPDKPAGVGFFVRATSAGPLQLFGVAEAQDLYPVDLEAGWTMVGCPFVTPVQWSSVLVVFRGETMTLQQAITRRLVAPAIWSFANGAYTPSISPQGQFTPFDARWVFVTQPLELLFPRTGPAGFAALNTHQPLAENQRKDGWRLPLALSVGTRVCATAAVGEAKNASDGFGPEDLPTPPPAIAAAAGMSIRPLNAGLRTQFTQDIRRSRRGARTWDLEVRTAQPAVTTRLTWGRPPAGMRVTVTDTQTGRVQSLNRKGELELYAAKPGVRRLRLTASPLR